MQAEVAEVLQLPQRQRVSDAQVQVELIADVLRGPRVARQDDGNGLLVLLPAQPRHLLQQLPLRTPEPQTPSSETASSSLFQEHCSQQRLVQLRTLKHANASDCADSSFKHTITA